MQTSEQLKIERLDRACASAEIDYWEYFLLREDPALINFEVLDRLRELCIQARDRLDERIAQTRPCWGVWEDLRLERERFATYRDGPTAETNRRSYRAALNRAIGRAA